MGINSFCQGWNDLPFGIVNSNAIPCLQVSLRWSSRETKVLPPFLLIYGVLHPPTTLIGSAFEDSFRWCDWGKGCLSVLSGLTAFLSLKCKFDFLCDNVLKLKRCNQASLISDLVKAGGAHSFRGNWELQETNCRWIYVLHVCFFKHNQFQFFGVFQKGFFLSVIWYPDLYFMLTCWPEPASEDICKDSTEASFKILQSKSRGFLLSFTISSSGYMQVVVVYDVL